jgi:hypothetical protein
LHSNKYSNLKLKEPLWEGNEGVVKRTGRDEPIWVVIYICMKTTQRISLYSYGYLKLTKCGVLLSFVFSSIKSENRRVEHVLPRGRGRRMVVGGRWQ